MSGNDNINQYQPTDFRVQGAQCQHPGEALPDTRKPQVKINKLNTYIFFSVFLFVKPKLV